MNPVIVAIILIAASLDRVNTKNDEGIHTIRSSRDVPSEAYDLKRKFEQNLPPLDINLLRSHTIHKQFMQNNTKPSDKTLINKKKREKHKKKSHQAKTRTILMNPTYDRKVQHQQLRKHMKNLSSRNDNTVKTKIIDEDFLITCIKKLLEKGIWLVPNKPSKSLPNTNQHKYQTLYSPPINVGYKNFAEEDFMDPYFRRRYIQYQAFNRVANVPYYLINPNNYNNDKLKKAIVENPYPYRFNLHKREIVQNESKKFPYDKLYDQTFISTSQSNILNKRIKNNLNQGSQSKMQKVNSKKTIKRNIGNNKTKFQQTTRKKMNIQKIKKVTKNVGEKENPYKENVIMLKILKFKMNNKINIHMDVTDKKRSVYDSEDPQDNEMALVKMQLTLD